MKLTGILRKASPPWRRLRSEGMRAWRLPLLSVAVGVVAGVGAILFFYMLDAASWLLQGHLAGYVPAA